METLDSTGPIDPGRGGMELFLSDFPELTAGVLGLLAYAAFFLWTFGSAELRGIRSLPGYSLSISEYRLSDAPSSYACP